MQMAILMHVILLVNTLHALMPHNLPCINGTIALRSTDLRVDTDSVLCGRKGYGGEVLRLSVILSIINQ